MVTASSAAVFGTFAHDRPGATSAPLQVYLAGMSLESSHGAVRLMPGAASSSPPPPVPALTASPSVVAVSVVVVMIDSVWLGPAGRRVRPSCEHATRPRASAVVSASALAAARAAWRGGMRPRPFGGPPRAGRGTLGGAPRAPRPPPA